MFVINNVQESFFKHIERILRFEDEDPIRRHDRRHAGENQFKIVDIGHGVIGDHRARGAELASQTLRHCEVEEVGTCWDPFGRCLGGYLLGGVNALYAHAGITEETEQRAVIAAELDHQVSRLELGAGNDGLAKAAKMVGQSKRDGGPVEIVSIDEAWVYDMDELDQSAVLAQIIIEWRNNPGEPLAGFILSRCRHWERRSALRRAECCAQFALSRTGGTSSERLGNSSSISLLRVARYFP